MPCAPAFPRYGHAPSDRIVLQRRIRIAHKPHSQSRAFCAATHFHRTGENTANACPLASRTHRQRHLKPNSAYRLLKPQATAVWTLNPEPRTFSCSPLRFPLTHHTPLPETMEKLWRFRFRSRPAQTFASESVRDRQRRHEATATLVYRPTRSPRLNEMLGIVVLAIAAVLLLALLTYTPSDQSFNTVVGTALTRPAHNWDRPLPDPPTFSGRSASGLWRCGPLRSTGHPAHRHLVDALSRSWLGHGGNPSASCSG